MVVSHQRITQLDTQKSSQSGLGLQPTNRLRRVWSAVRARQKNENVAPRFSIVAPDESPAATAVSIRLASKREELLAAFRLVYQEYLHTGLVQPNRYSMRLTPYHLLPTTDVIAAFDQRGEALCTVSLVSDGRLGLPIDSVFGDIIAERRRRGSQLAEVTSLADNRNAEGTGRGLLMKVMGFMAQCAQHRGIDELLITVHPHHVKFYQRFIGFEPIGEERPCGAVLNRPAIPLALDLSQSHVQSLDCYERFLGNRFPTTLFRSRTLSPMLRSEMQRILAACNPGTPVTSEQLVEAA